MIEVDGLTRYYGSFPAVRDISFTIDDNVIVGFLGLNGAGKSTVLKVLGGLLPPSAGSVRVGGVDMADAPDSAKARIGFLPEEPPLYRDMRVVDFLTWCGQLKGMDGQSLADRVVEVMQLCHLTEVANRVIDALSHGYRKRVGIAQAIIHKPDLVILDEPISGLDPVQIVEMRDVLKALKGSCTILVSSHILSEISQTCDHILVLHKGTIVAQGAQDQLAGRLREYHRLDITVRGSRSAALDVANAVSVSVKCKSEGDDLHTLSLALEEDTREEVVRKLVEAGLGIRSVADGESGLESVFLGLTSDDAFDGAIRDSGPDGTLSAEEEE